MATKRNPEPARALLARAGVRMTRVIHTKNFQELFKRYRRPGDLAFATLFFALSIGLLICLPSQTDWVKRTKTFAQPAFWPMISIALMAVFSMFHLLGSLVSERIEGRWLEVWQWIRSLEYALWFMAYVMLVPVIGYLPATIAFTCVLALRLGYRGWRWMLICTVFSIAVVVLFKSFLQVKIPAGLIYEAAPAPFRAILMTYF
ncbi:tripartite tricarboxylate transporter TctB family protein [Thioclava indica]|uniref:DUF1468 domain-containing protein n=1 Tax=Thioclava indica TaxID=1353528 RepID=A0A074JPW8_9RHOB|nr:tripartite tricarboxylate transporter TctB family protein [Thioclava indica]KEO51437.1 hypothetical protein DT23_09120 [Thioclava indica]